MLKTYVWVGLVGFLGLLAAVVILIVTGHDTNTLIAATAALAPIVGGVVALLRGQDQIRDQNQTVVSQTNGNVDKLVKLLAAANASLERSVPTNAVVSSSTVPPETPVVVPEGGATG